MEAGGYAGIHHAAHFSKGLKCPVIQSNQEKNTALLAQATVRKTYGASGFLKHPEGFRMHEFGRTHHFAHRAFPASKREKITLGCPSEARPQLPGT